MAFPTINACIVCEQVRQEAGNKAILLGFYGITPYVRINILNFNAPVVLCFVFTGGPGFGHFRVELRITAPNGRVFEAPHVEGDLAQEATLTNIFMGFQETLPGPGPYLATLLVDGAVQYQAPFTLANPHALEAPPLGRPN